MKTPMHLIVTLIALFLSHMVGVGQYVAIFLMAVWCSREVTQAEYRWIAAYGQGKRANMPWWGGFDPKAWDFNSFVIDMVAPVVLCLIYLAMRSIL